MPENGTLEEGRAYSGPLGALRPSAWLTHEDIEPDGDTVKQIDKVIVRDEVDFVGQKKVDYGSLRFVGEKKELGLNATHINVLKKMFPGCDRNAGLIFGKYIALFVDHDVPFKGDVVSAIRIRSRRTDQEELAKAKIEQDKKAAAAKGNGGS